MSQAKTESFASVWDAIADTAHEAANLRVRSELMSKLAAIVEQGGWTQAEAARRCGITQPRINDLLRGRLSRFSLDALVNIATAAERKPSGGACTWSSRPLRDPSAGEGRLPRECNRANGADRTARRRDRVSSSGAAPRTRREPAHPDPDHILSARREEPLPPCEHVSASGESADALQERIASSRWFARPRSS